MFFLEFNGAFFDRIDLLFFPSEYLFCFLRVFNHPGGYKNVKVGFNIIFRFVSKQPAQEGNITQCGDFVFIGRGGIIDQSADDDGLLILDNNGGVHRAFQGDGQGG